MDKKTKKVENAKAKQQNTEEKANPTNPMPNKTHINLTYNERNQTI